VRVHRRNSQQQEREVDFCRRDVRSHSPVCVVASTISIADFVNVVKSNSSRWVHESFSHLRSFAWQEGYGAFSVSKSEENKVIRYVLNQEQHAKRTFKQELLSLLKKH